VKIPGVVPAEQVHLPQYWSLFAIGIVAGRGKWLESIPSSLGPKWMAIGMAVFVIALITQPNGYVFSESILPDAMTLGAKQWGILWGLLEAFVCVGLIIGLSILFRDQFSAPNKWIGHPDKSVFGVYFFHVFIQVGLQGAMLSIDLPALVKFAIVAIAGLIISFLPSGLLRLIPIIKRVIEFC
jgi:glucan biosynthesis protein C